MPVPSYKHFIDPLLRFLVSMPEEYTTRPEAAEHVAQVLGLTSLEKEETTSSGHPLYVHRTGWAHDRLLRAKLSDRRHGRGRWTATEAGRRLVEVHPVSLPPSIVDEIALPRVINVTWKQWE